MALPTIYATFANSKTPKKLVPVYAVLTAEKQNIPALPNQPASSASYRILFTLVRPFMDSKEITIDYGQNATQRDTDLAAFETATCQVI